ncbi:MAG: DUF3501 family protein [Gammaproteobacteria bacterium]
MAGLSIDDLMSLEEYHRERPGFRARVLEHKRDRRIAIGPNTTLYFEDRLTVQYQVQEMLRIERLFEREAIEEELSAYNPLIPDGSNFKATFMVEFPDPEERRRELARLTGVEDNVFAQVDGCVKVMAIADEDLDRSTDDKTSAVHFLRFELDDQMKAALEKGAELSFGIVHPNYSHAVAAVSDNVRDSLANDLD